MSSYQCEEQIVIICSDDFLYLIFSSSLSASLNDNLSNILSFSNIQKYWWNESVRQFGAIQLLFLTFDLMCSMVSSFPLGEHLPEGSVSLLCN